MFASFSADVQKSVRCGMGNAPPSLDCLSRHPSARWAKRWTGVGGRFSD